MCDRDAGTLQTWGQYLIELHLLHLSRPYAWNTQICTHALRHKLRTVLTKWCSYIRMKESKGEGNGGWVERASERKAVREINRGFVRIEKLYKGIDREMPESPATALWEIALLQLKRLSHMTDIYTQSHSNCTSYCHQAFFKMSSRIQNILLHTTGHFHTWKKENCRPITILVITYLLPLEQINNF